MAFSFSTNSKMSITGLFSMRLRAAHIRKDSELINNDVHDVSHAWR
jgi:hypothetical protein